MSYKIAQITSIEEMRQHVGEIKRGGNSIALVPTMGYLHEGHMSLVDRAISLAEHVIVSIYVNPLQFGPHEDLESYPRNIEKDIRRLSDRGVGAVFLPSDKELYPGNYSTFVAVEGLTQSLCGRSRPTHFRGVTTVVTKLFNVVGPDYAVFGEKDYQQLQMIRHLVKDLDIPTEICGVPTVRETDGLAISSRNVYLSKQERARAAQINLILAATATRLTEGHEPAKELANALSQLNKKVGYTPEYLELCDAETLAPITELNTPARLLTAIIINRTRLIDNWPVMPPTT